MKRSWMFLLLLVAVAAPVAAKSQVSAYGEFSVAQFQNLAFTDNLYGASVGVLVDGPKFGRHILVAGDIQGRFVKSSTESFKGITLGPRLQFPIGHKLVPYAEFMVGFARYNDPSNPGATAKGTTDGTIQINGGVSRPISPRMDVVADFSYAQYYAIGGQFNPKTYSVGAIYHFKKR